MAYRGSADLLTGDSGRIGVLITNLGTPDAPTTPALRRYLREFLSDPRVVEVPRLIWWLVLNLVILVIRPPRSAKAYASVWTERGSPLMFHTEDQCSALREALHARFGNELVVEFAMRYGTPSISSTLDTMQRAGVTQLIVLPLYPQYSGSTGGSTLDAVNADLCRRRWVPSLHFISDYHDFDPYIEAMAERIRTHWAEHGRADRLLLSYHGIPKRYVTQGDPYQQQCLATSAKLRAALGLAEEECLTTFQSRFGREEWLKPYTDHTLKALPGEGVRSVQVFCPGFSADCLETIEEIGEENREYFMESGGERYEYIAALNATSAHIEALADLVGPVVAGWVGRWTSDVGR
ncbi:ferrochelatase [Isoalcanivorax pacificus W11-5]|uniref:Ferrochelatase n=1 Tax=Isoalcanivorax pacificus W11-5 TaxID=391936 RepID=A0A0B4XIG1_9GAMM|nr:ferrochelatase [Isoalcanivorax pacificus]AJD46861.1 ferrochelatase [Isoalcanivorax pacificus W11-5]